MSAERRNVPAIVAAATPDAAKFAGRGRRCPRPGMLW